MTDVAIRGERAKVARSRQAFGLFVLGTSITLLTNQACSSGETVVDGPLDSGSVDSSIAPDGQTDAGSDVVNTLDVFEGGQTQDGAPLGSKDKPIVHGSEVDASVVGPHKTPSGTVHNVPFTISAAGSYSNISFKKGLTITADDVEIFDCLITTDNVASSFNVRVLGNNVRIHHCEIDNQSKVYYAIENNGGRANARNRFYRNDIHHAGQGISSAFSYWDFEENFVHDIVAPDPPANPGDELWHADGVISWGEHITVARNKILVPIPQTGAINIGTWVGMPAHDVTDIRIDSNYLAGAGFIFYVEERGVQKVKDFRIVNNKIGQDYYPKGGYYGLFYSGAPPAERPTVSGNTLVSSPGGAFVSNVDYP